MIYSTLSHSGLYYIIFINYNVSLKVDFPPKFIQCFISIHKNNQFICSMLRQWQMIVSLPSQSTLIMAALYSGNNTHFNITF